MRIAIDAREMSGQLAGKGRYIYELVRALAELDSSNQYILYSKSELSIALPKNFTKVVIGGKPGLRQLWLANDVKARDCELLFAPTGYLPVIFSKVPVIVTVHDLAIFVTKDTRPALRTLVAERLLLSWAVKKSAAILSVSESTKSDLIRLFKTSEKKIQVTPLGYDQQSYVVKADATADKKVLDNYQLTPGYLLFIGTLEPRKNIVSIITAYSQLTSAQQEQYPLVIGGKKGWFYEEIFATVQRLGLENKVHFLGRVEDSELPALYRGAKLFLFPSFYEGFGLPPLEAMACGTPVITSNISSLPEVVGEAGWLVDPHNLLELVEALTILITHEDRYLELKKKAPAQAAQFSWQKTAVLTRELFERVGNSD